MKGLGNKKEIIYLLLVYWYWVFYVKFGVKNKRKFNEYKLNFIIVLKEMEFYK